MISVIKNILKKHKTIKWCMNIFVKVKIWKKTSSIKKYDFLTIFSHIQPLNYENEYFHTLKTIFFIEKKYFPVLINLI